MADSIIPKALDRRPLIGSYTLLNTYLTICPYQAAQRFVYKNVPFFETPEMKRGKDGHTALELRVGAGRPLPLALQQYEPFAVPFDGRGAVVEGNLGVTARGQPCDFFDNKSVFFRGKVDVSIVKGSAAFINDWKFGRSKYQTTFELECFAMLIHAKHPNLKQIVGTYTWLVENRISEVYDLSDTAGTWRAICTAMGQIEADRARGVWEKRQGPLCGYCPCKECEHNRSRE